MRAPSFKEDLYDDELPPDSRERYDLSYIEREAYLILHFFRPKKNRHRINHLRLTSRDIRILTSWGYIDEK